jgi:hypothetical protein
MRKKDLFKKRKGAVRRGTQGRNIWKRSSRRTKIILENEDLAGSKAKVREEGKEY